MPEWTAPSLAAAFGDGWVAEGQAMAGRPPLDLRVNTLQLEPRAGGKVAGALSSAADGATRPTALRLPPGPRDARTPNVTTDEGYLKGWFEVQDQGSQLAALLAGAKPGEQVLDLCAGAGGKTLAMAAAMDNKGQIFAYDSDRGRLAPIYDRLKRNGVRNVQVRAPDPGALDDLVGQDGPRRDRRALHRLGHLAPAAGRQVEADAGAAGGPRRRAGGAPRRGGALREARRRRWSTSPARSCPRRTSSRSSGLSRDHPEFAVAAGAGLWAKHFGEAAGPRFPAAGGVALSPHLTETDGFYVVVCSRAG